jgi:hypothetical protein
MRQTRNACVLLAAVAGIVCAPSLIVGIIMGVQLAKVDSQLSNLNGSSTSSNCMSQGGTNPDCWPAREVNMAEQAADDLPYQSGSSMPAGP